MIRQGVVLIALSTIVASVVANGTPAPIFDPANRTVSTWRTEAATHLILSGDKAAALLGEGPVPSVARCIKLNNYWCIKKAGWDGELAADNEGHVAFASAVEGAAVAAILLKRYYVDFDRKTAMAIISRWAPAQCGFLAAGPQVVRRRMARSPVGKADAPAGIGHTLRARWLAGHVRGFAAALPGHSANVPRSKVADHIGRMMATPTIAVGLGEPSRPMTLDAFLKESPNAPPSRSMLGMSRGSGAAQGTLSACGADSGRIANYAAKAAAGITVGTGDDLALFDEQGRPTSNLVTMMINMAQVEIGPDAASRDLVVAGIGAAFRPGRNDPTKQAEEEPPQK